MLLSASLAAGMRPGWFLNMITWVEPLDQNSMYALAASSSAGRFPDFAEICQMSIGASSAPSASNCVPRVGNGKKSRSSRSAWTLVAANWAETKRPSRYMPDFFWTSVSAAFCQVRPA